MIELSLPRTTPDTLLARRGFLRASLGGAGGLAALPQLAAAAGGVPAGRKAVIQIWLGGGPSHIDLYDMKPHAPIEHRGPFRPIATRQPGIDVCELLPRHAPIMQHLSVIRSLHHNSNDHVAGTHWMQTGHFGATAQQPESTHPSVGSWIARARAGERAAAPAYVHIRPDLAIDLYSRQFNAAHLGGAFDPLHVVMPFPGYSNQIRFERPSLDDVPGLDADRLGDRLNLREQFDGRRGADRSGHATPDDFYRQAFDLVTSEQVRRAFDLSQETQHTRDRYGETGWGQAALLCRRLVEAGVSFVTLNTDSSSNMWDNHIRVEHYFKIMLPAYDRMLSALIEDLVERGLYDQVIVLVWGEFGRTPGINANGGRDHWGSAACALVGGGGLRGGTVFGSTTPLGEEPLDLPRTPGDLLATIFHLLQIDPAQQITTRFGRPQPILADGAPIHELLS